MPVRSMLIGTWLPPGRASGSKAQIAVGYFIGAALMVLGGVAEILLGVKAEQQTLESIAKPLAAQDASGDARPAGASA
jgi:hypothetical protein